MREALRQRAADECDAEADRSQLSHAEPTSGRTDDRREWPSGAGGAIGECVKEQLAAIGDLIGGLETATDAYRRRPLDWDDVASLKLVREQLVGTAQGFRDAGAAAALRRAARQVASDVRQLR